MTTTGSTGKHRHRHRREPQPHKHAVRMIEEAPEGIDMAEPTPKKRDQLSDALNIDLSAPLKETEVLPTIQKYPHKTEAPSVAPVPKKEEPIQEERKHRHRRHKGDDKEGKHKRRSKKEEKSSSKTAAAQPASTGGGLLIDLGFDAPSPAPAPATAPAPAVVPVAAAPIATSTPSPIPAASYARIETPPVTTPVEESGKHRRHRSHRSDREETGHRHHRSHKTSSAPVDPAAASVPNPAPVVSGEPKLLRVVTKKKVAVAGKDDNVHISYTLSAAADTPKNIIAAVTVKNLADDSISDVTLDCTDTLNLQLVRPSRGQPVTMAAEIDALSDEKFTVPFSFTLYTRPQKISSIISYKLAVCD